MPSCLPHCSLPTSTLKLLCILPLKHSCVVQNNSQIKKKSFPFLLKYKLLDVMVQDLFIFVEQDLSWYRTFSCLCLLSSRNSANICQINEWLYLGLSLLLDYDYLEDREYLPCEFFTHDDDSK